LSRAVYAGPALALACALLAGCLYVPEPVQGVPSGGGWVSLPLRGWIAESAVRADAIAACFAPDCAPRVGVGIFRASGEEARTVQSVLRDPERLTRFIAERDAADSTAQRKSLRTVASIETLREGGAQGFFASLSREDGSRPAYTAVIGAQARDAFRFAIVIGESAEGVRMTAREIAGKLK
jgi:hypothetical protein